MAQFPSLIPSEAPITPGTWPATHHQSLNGAESSIRHGSVAVGGMWRPRFANITYTDFLAILDHYRGRRSQFDSFGFDPITLAADRTPAGCAWLHASRPQIVDQHVDVFTVQCEFRCEPRGLVAAPGRAWRTGATTFTPGARSGGVVYAAGVQWVTSSTTFKPQYDPDFSSNSLLLHFEGSNNSTTFTDSSANANTVSVFGNAKLSTSRSRFGAASGIYDGSGDYLTCPAPPGGLFDFASSDFTLQVSIYTTTVSGIQQIAGVWPSDATSSWRLIIVDDTIEFIWRSGSIITVSSSSCITANTWLDIAAKRVGSDLLLVCNATQVGIGSISSIAANPAGGLLDIGRQQDGLGGNVWGFNGSMDEMRITKGVGRDIQPLTRPFPNY